LKIVLSTSNPDKVQEILEIVDLDIEWVVKKIEVEEDGKTFQENAIKKAKAAYDLYGPAVADDSGLEIYALDNFPGVRSARFMEGADYSVKNSKIIEMLRDIGENERGARFSCVAVYYDEYPHVFKGVIEGKIAFEARGNNGFGYDPIFIPYGYNKSMAELSRAEKNKISHRAQAFRKLSEYLSSMIKGT